MPFPTKLGCPVANGFGPCRMCGGNWPGTKITHEKMLTALRGNKLNSNKLGCGTLIEQFKQWEEEHGDTK